MTAPADGRADRAADRPQHLVERHRRARAPARRPRGRSGPASRRRWCRCRRRRGTCPTSSSGRASCRTTSSRLASVTNSAPSGSMTVKLSRCANARHSRLASWLPIERGSMTNPAQNSGMPDAVAGARRRLRDQADHRDADVHRRAHRQAGRVGQQHVGLAHEVEPDERVVGAASRATPTRRARRRRRPAARSSSPIPSRTAGPR